jgi:hypothetical protein
MAPTDQWERIHVSMKAAFVRVQKKSKAEKGCIAAFEEKRADKFRARYAGRIDLKPAGVRRLTSLAQDKKKPALLGRDRADASREKRAEMRAKIGLNPELV